MSPDQQERTKGDCLYLFQNNLRLRDNPSLQYAYLNYWKVVPVFIIPDKANHYAYKQVQEMGVFRRKFLLEAAIALKEALAKKNIDLILLRGNADTPKRLAALCKAYQLDEVVTSYPRGTYAQERLAHLCRFTNVYTLEDDSLLLAEDLPFKHLPKSFSAFRKKIEANLDIRDKSPLPVFNAFKNDKGFGDVFQLEATELHPNTAHSLQGGETAAWEHLHYYFWETQHLASYKETRNGMIGLDYSSKLSAYLALGNLSPVQIYYAIQQFEREKCKNDSTYWLFFELLWREFFIWVAASNGSAIFQLGGIQHRQDLTPSTDNATFESWCLGKTAHPFINAAMKELVATGYTSNRARQNAASYLVHHLGIDWRWGAAFYEQHLVDYDVSSNWCNWMYIAGVGNSTRSAIFNPTSQQERYDAAGHYVNLWNTKA